MKFTIGIDPGMSGGIAALAGTLEEVTKMPATDGDTVELLREYRETAANMGATMLCFVELVHSMPRQGVSSSFKFGRGYGALLGILAALQIPYELVTPQKWQKAMGCMTKGNKNVSKRKAQALFPSIKVTHAVADALLIARYGQHKDCCEERPF